MRGSALASAAIAAGMCLLVAGCDGQAPVADASATPSSDDADASQLRAMKASAGIEPCPRSDGAAAESGGLPPLTLDCLGGGRSVDLSRLTGAPMVVNVWAQWCGPCRAEAPAFQELHEEAAGRLRVIGIDYQDTQADLALAFADELGLTYPQLADPQGDSRAALGFTGPPTTYFVAADGEVVYAESGPITSFDELEELATEHLGVKL